MALAKLVDNRLTLKRAVGAQMRFDWMEERERFEVPEEQGNVERAAIFPPEVWDRIFGFLDKPEDIRSCYWTCQDFQEILSDRLHIWLIGKILPILASGKYLSVKDVLSCRSTCTLWRKLVDQFLESEESWVAQTGSTIAKRPLISYRQRRLRSIDRDPLVLSGHIKNPILSRSITLDSNSFILSNNSPSWASHVWHIQLIISPYDRNLDGDLMENCARLFPNLKSFFVGHDPRAVVMSRNSLPAFCSQLRNVELRGWNRSHSDNNEWLNLRTLQVGTLNMGVITTLKNLYRLKAPNLERLGIKANSPNIEEGQPILQVLLQTLNKFSKLKELELELNHHFQISEEEIENTSVNLPDVCSISLESCALKTGFSDSISYSMLIYFPYLKHLRLSYGFNELDSEENIRDPTWLGNAPSRNIKNTRLFELVEQRRVKELVDIRNYLYTKRSEMHKCNVWNIFPFLQDIEITDYYLDYWSRFGTTTETIRKN